MSYKVRVYTKRTIKDLTLDPSKGTMTIGSSDADTLTIKYDDIQAKQLAFSYVNGQWVCKDKRTQAEKSTKDGDMFVLSEKHRIAAAIYDKDYVPQSVRLKPNLVLTIGRSQDSMLHLADRSVGREHATVTLGDMGAVIQDLNSLNGTYVNQKKISKEILKDGDIISIGRYNILYRANELSLCEENDAKEPADVPLPEKNVEYPIFHLSPRLRHQAPSDVIEIQAPPNIGGMPMVNWLAFLPMLATRSAYSAIFPLTSLFSTFLQKRKYKKAQEVRQEKYENYLAGVKAKIDKNREDQFLSLEESNHETSRCFEIATKRERTLWERTPEDDDFMKIRIGKGDIETSFRIKFPDSVLKMYNDELEGQGEELGRGNQIIENAPILCDLYHDLSVGIIGDREKAISIARNMIVQVATTHSYKDVKLVTLFSKKESAEWEFVKWLPHSFHNSREFRYVANNMFSASTLDKIMDEELKGRKQKEENEPGKKPEGKKPFYLFVVTDSEMLEYSEIENYLAANQEGFGIGVIYVYNRIHDLPKSCSIIIDIQKDKNEVFHKSNVGIKQTFKIDKFTAEKAEHFARKLAPVRLAERKSSAGMPTCVTFLEGYGVQKVEELPIWENWNTYNAGKSMAVPLGVRANGEPFMFNVLPGANFMKYHGPFGLVAGSPGSGKSEMMQSWILSLAAKFSPEDLSFIIVDYKGTGLLQPFKKLPHLIGTISNLDGNVRRNIIALKKEQQRRQAIFDEVGIIPQDIKEYHKRGYHKTHKKMPFIIMIVDEFAEIKANLPEFVPMIESMFAVGRSLGIYVIVSTQKPSGVVTDKMYGLSQYRWCCRVASDADSKEMIKRVDAANITNAGRACVLIGNDDIYEQVQSYWSGAPYQPDKKEKSAQDIPLAMVDMSGKRIQFETYQKESSNDKIKEVDVVVDYMNRLAEENALEKARPVWQEKLKNRIYLEEVQPKQHITDFIVNVGLVDNPYKQAQYPLAIDFTNGGHCMVYGAPGTGKTTFLQTVVMSAAQNYSAAELNIYAMDFGSWSLNLFSRLPQVGGVAIDSEAEKIDKLVNMLKKELDARRKAFALKGLSNIKAYNKETEQKLPYILLVVDNFNAALTQYPDLSEFFGILVQQSANYGIYLIATMGKEIYKISGAVKNNNIALQQKDRSEYSSIVGKTDGMEPENTFGRGLIKGMPIAHEFQTALPAFGEDDNEVLYNLKAKIAEYAQNSDIKAKAIPVMPEVITYDMISGRGIALGLATENIERISIDYQQAAHCIAISEEYQNRGVPMMQAILKQFIQKEAAEIILYDTDSELYIPGVISVESAAEFDEKIAALAAELNKRQKMEDISDQPTIVIAVHGYRKMYESIDDKTAVRLSAIVKKGKGLKVYLVVSEEAERLSTLCSIEPIVKSVVKEGIGILVGGSFKTHNAFYADMPYSTANAMLDPSEAYIVENGKAVKFKVIDSM